MKLRLLTLVSLVLFFISCENHEPMFLNKNEDFSKMQSKVEKLSKGNQIDSISIRSTERKSAVSSIYVITTDENDSKEYKTGTEYIPKYKFVLDEITSFEKSAMHAYKPDLISLTKLIESAKDMLPEGYTYKDVCAINYSASPFGAKYYFSLEVNSLDIKNENEYVELQFDSPQAQAAMTTQGFNTDNLTTDTHHVISFIVDNNNINMLKAPLPETDEK